MIDSQRQEAEAIIAALEAQLRAAQRELEDLKNERAGGAPAGGVSKNALCTGCYAWRIVFGLVLSACCGVAAWHAVDNNRPFVQAMFADVDSAQLCLTIAASLLPLVLVGLHWQVRLYKAGYPGVIRALANMRAEFKRGLRG